jgi:hypothetical protein
MSIYAAAHKTLDSTAMFAIFPTLNPPAAQWIIWVVPNYHLTRIPA